MNSQPFYHRIEGLLFTSTRGFSEEEFLAAFRLFVKIFNDAIDFGVIPESIEIENYMEPEPGDPADLM